MQLGGLLVSSNTNAGRQSSLLKKTVFPIVAAVEQRLRGTQLQRVDGIILGSVDVDEFDITVC
jgi:hypothetical protein